MAWIPARYKRSAVLVCTQTTDARGVMTSRVRAHRRSLVAIGGYTCLPIIFFGAYAGPPKIGYWWDICMVLGAAGAGGMALLPLLSARWWASAIRDAHFLRLIQYLHRYLSYALTALIAVHIAGLLVIEPRVIEYLKLSAPWSMLSGLLGTVLVAVLLVTSIARERLGIRYGTWRRWHAGMSAAAMGLILFHLLGSGYYFDSAPRLFALTLVVAMPTAATLRYWHELPPRTKRPAAMAPVHTLRPPSRIPVQRQAVRVVAWLMALWTALAALYAIPPAKPPPAGTEACAVAACS